MQEINRPIELTKSSFFTMDVQQKQDTNALIAKNFSPV